MRHKAKSPKGWRVAARRDSLSCTWGTCPTRPVFGDRIHGHTRPAINRHISMTEEIQPRKPSTAAKPRKRFVGSKSAAPSKPGPLATITNQIPDEILSDPLLNQAIKQLPANYSFEIHKTVHHVRKNNAKAVALQMPEGLQMFACTIADIIERCAGDGFTLQSCMLN